MQLTLQQMESIGTTIRAVTQAESKRYFKTERNTPLRTRMVQGLIVDAIILSLNDMGLSLEQMKGVEPGGVIIDQMRASGYDLGDVPPLDDAAIPASALIDECLTDDGASPRRFVRLYGFDEGGR